MNMYTYINILYYIIIDNIQTGDSATKTRIQNQNTKHILNYVWQEWPNLLWYQYGRDQFTRL
jgi:hypothetical protein